MEQRIDALEERVSEIEAQLRVNTATIQSIKNDTAEIVALMKGSKIGGKVLLWVAIVASACVSIYTAFRDTIHGRP